MWSRISAACFLVIPDLPATSAAICDLESAFAIFEFGFVNWFNVVRLARIKAIHPTRARRKITFSQGKIGFFRVPPSSVPCPRRLKNRRSSPGTCGPPRCHLPGAPPSVERRGATESLGGSAGVPARRPRLRVRVASRHPHRPRTETVRELAAETAALQV